MKVSAFLLAFCLAAPSQTLAGNSPPTAVVTAVTQELEAGGGDTRLAKRLLTPVRIGQESAWRADFEQAGAVDWCGSGGCRVMLYVQKNKHWQAVFDRQVREFRLEGERLTVELYGKFCGKAGNAPCMARYRWDADRRAWRAQDKAPPPVDEL